MVQPLMAPSLLLTFLFQTRFVSWLTQPLSQSTKFIGKKRKNQIVSSKSLKKNLQKKNGIQIQIQIEISKN